MLAQDVASTQKKAMGESKSSHGPPMSCSFDSARLGDPITIGTHEDVSLSLHFFAFRTRLYSSPPNPSTALFAKGLIAHLFHAAIMAGRTDALIGTAFSTQALVITRFHTPRMAIRTVAALPATHLISTPGQAVVVAPLATQLSAAFSAAFSFYTSANAAVVALINGRQCTGIHLGRIPIRRACGQSDSDKKYNPRAIHVLPLSFCRFQQPHPRPQLTYRSQPTLPCSQKINLWGKSTE
jgi:hypothetical protein